MQEYLFYFFEGGIQTFFHQNKFSTSFWVIALLGVKKYRYTEKETMFYSRLRYL